MVTAWQVYGTNSPLVPTLAAPLATVSTSPLWLLLVQLPVTAALLLGSWLLARELGAGPTAAWLVAGATAVLPAYTSYTAILHFAPAASAALVWSTYALLRSDDFRSARWSAVTGLVLGALSLTRVLAPVYGLALLLPAAVQLAVAARRAPPGRRLPWRNLALAAGCCLLVAAPWWIACGRSATGYLFGSGFTGDFVAAGRSPGQRVLDRLDRLETGVLASVALALPLVVLATVVVGAGLAQLRGRSGALLAAGAAVLLAVTVLGQFAVLPAAEIAGRPAWIIAYPGRAPAAQALGLDAVRADAGARVRAATNALVRRAGSRRLLIARDDALVNLESVGAAARVAGVRSRLSVVPYSAAAVTPGQLAGADEVLSGSTALPLHPQLGLPALDAQLASAGWRRVMRTDLLHVNSLELWFAP